MSTRKKRSLSGVIANDSEVAVINNKIILPATSRTLNQDKKNNHSEAVRGTEFLVEPSDCRPWKFHNRDNVWMNVDKCQDLISSIRKNGQKVPIFARKIENDPDGKNWEIIAGRRRWFACNHLGIKIRVKATDANDRECAILMNLENKDRNDISEFEDAISFKQQLEANLFDSQDEMAIALDLKKSKLSKMLSAAKIVEYKEIIELFKDITLLKINPVYSLVILLEKSSMNEELIIKKAEYLRDVISSRKSPIKTNVIINELIGSVDNEDKKKNKTYRAFKLDEKVIIKTNEITSRKVVFELNKSNLINFSPEEIKNVVLEALNEYMAEHSVS
ncbi:ParB/RepB/Spo0J family partition protein [Legionella fallonii]|uniref:Plasmid partition protein n=1 Tax=Legionella fallonii LLAP-10 TaxID=1212491 RepID=A0A098GB48_9GAMM|nr:ParB/RepB/Spo0J family partition protein [Legionella fallonii]CEG59205.1 plasmid partition protein [Legionella fallonii LLAP-10]